VERFFETQCLTTTTTLHAFNGFFSRTTWLSRHQTGKPFWVLLEQEMMGWQWHQLDHMQIICTLLTTDTSPLSFYSPDALPAGCRPINSIKALKVNLYEYEQSTCKL